MTDAELVEKHGWISGELTDRLRDMAGLRNVLVHGYADLDLGIVEEVLAERLDDFLDFGRQIRKRLPE